MRKYTLLFLFLFSATWLIQAQTWTRMQSWGLDFESIHWVSTEKGFIAGENLIVYTEDGGLTWKEVLQKFDFRFYDIEFLDENRGLAAGENGTIFLSNDGGNSWQKINSNTSKTIYALELLPDGKAVFVGENGLVLRSESFGATPQIINSGISITLFDLDFSSQNMGIAVGAQGNILQTVDGGLTWSTLNSGTTMDLRGVQVSPTNKIYAAGNSGTIISSVDGGTSWNSLPSLVTTNLTKIALSPLDERILVVTGELNTILRSTNSGSTFSKINLPNTNERTIKSLAFKPGAAIAYFVGQDGYSMYSNNSGGGWAVRLLGIRNNFGNVDFKSSAFGYISGERGQVFVTSNGYTSILSRPTPEAVELKALDFWNTSFGYVSAPSGKMYRTSNSGTAWVDVSLSTSETALGFYLFAPSVLYVSGTNGYIARSFDSGVTWDANIATNTSENLKDLTYFDYSTGFAIGENGQISWTYGGSTWENLPKLTHENLNALAKIDSTTAMIVGNKGIVLKSSDMAKTWEILPFPENVDLLSVDFWNASSGMVSGKSGLTYQTKDGGMTWVKISTGTTRDITSVSYGDPNTIFAVGDDGTILKYNCTTPGDLSDISGPLTSCLSTQIYSIPDAPAPGSEIQWRVDGGNILSGQGTNTVQVNWTTAGRNGIFVSRVNFCGSGATSFLDVQVSDIPSSDLIIDGEGSVCKESQTSYTLPNLSGVTYQWTLTGGTIIQGQGSNRIEVIWQQEGPASVQVILENTCGKSETIQLPIQINVPPAQPSPILGRQLASIGEQRYSVENVEGLDYQWSIADGGQILSGQGTHNILVRWEKEGKFDLSVAAQNYCDFGPASSLAVEINIITGIEPNPDDGALKIYPNPSQGNITMESTHLDQWTLITVYNALGQKIAEKTIAPGEQIQFMEGLPRGLLIVSLSGPKGKAQKKIQVR